jgi:hypothetical protein
LRSAVARATGVEPAFQLTVEPVAKPVPVTDRVKSGEPATVETGEIELTAGPTTVKTAKLDCDPPGFCTTMLAEPLPEIKLAGTAAVSLVEFTKVVARASTVDPFQLTTEPAT